MSRKYNWTVSIIVQQDGEHLFEYVDLEQSILDQVFDPKIRYIIYYYEQGSKTALIKELTHSNSFGVNYFTVISKRQLVNIYAEGTLISFFTDFVNKDSESTHHIVITWGHGAGLGFFSRDLDDTNKIDYFAGLERQLSFDGQIDQAELDAFNRDIKAVTFLSGSLPLPKEDMKFTDGPLATYLNNKYTFYSKWKGEGFDRSKNIVRALEDRMQVISPNSLASILSAGFNNRPIDMLIAVNCYTQTIETAFELRERVDLLVSPQTTFPFAGIDYRKLFTSIADPLTKLEDLPDNITCNFSYKYTTEPFATQFKQRWPDYDLQRVAFSVNKLSKIERLSETVSQLGAFFLDNIIRPFNRQQLSQIIDGARANCKDVTFNDNHGLIDITHFLERTIFFLNGSSAEIATLFQEFSSLKDQTIVSQVKPPLLFIPNEEGQSESPNFLSIFFPSTLNRGDDIVQFILATFYTSRPGNEHTFMQYKWDEFINSFINNHIDP